MTEGNGHVIDPNGDARRALLQAVADHGPEVLSDTAVMDSVCREQLTGLPGESILIGDAARTDVPALLGELIPRLGNYGAIQSAATTLAGEHNLDMAASLWVVREFARALGYIASGPATGTSPSFPGSGPRPVPGSGPRPVPGSGPVTGSGTAEAGREAARGADTGGGEAGSALAAGAAGLAAGAAGAVAGAGAGEGGQDGPAESEAGPSGVTAAGPVGGGTTRGTGGSGGAGTGERGTGTGERGTGTGERGTGTGERGTNAGESAADRAAASAGFASVGGPGGSGAGPTSGDTGAASGSPGVTGATGAPEVTAARGSRGATGASSGPVSAGATDGAAPAGGPGVDDSRGASPAAGSAGDSGAWGGAPVAGSPGPYGEAPGGPGPYSGAQAAEGSGAAGGYGGAPGAGGSGGGSLWGAAPGGGALGGAAPEGDPGFPLPLPGGQGQGRRSQRAKVLNRNTVGIAAAIALVAGYLGVAAVAHLSPFPAKTTPPAQSQSQVSSPPASTNSSAASSPAASADPSPPSQLDILTTKIPAAIRNQDNKHACLNNGTGSGATAVSQCQHLQDIAAQVIIYYLYPSQTALASGLSTLLKKANFRKIRACTDSAGNFTDFLVNCQSDFTIKTLGLTGSISEYTNGTQAIIVSTANDQHVMAVLVGTNAGDLLAYWNQQKWVVHS